MASQKEEKLSFPWPRVESVTLASLAAHLHRAVPEQALMALLAWCHQQSQINVKVAIATVLRKETGRRPWVFETQTQPTNPEANKALLDRIAQESDRDPYWHCQLKDATFHSEVEAVAASKLHLHARIQRADPTVSVTGKYTVDKSVKISESLQSIFK